jgi:hypothetical protein
LIFIQNLPGRLQSHRAVQPKHQGTRAHAGPEQKGTTIDPAGTSGTTQKLANICGSGRVGRFDGQSGCSATGANHYLREQRVFEVTYTDCRGNATVYIYDLQGNEC